MAQGCQEESPSQKQKTQQNEAQETQELLDPRGINSVEVSQKQCVQLINSEENGNCSISNETVQVNGGGGEHEVEEEGEEENIDMGQNEDSSQEKNYQENGQDQEEGHELTSAPGSTGPSSATPAPNIDANQQEGEGEEEEEEEEQEHEIITATVSDDKEGERSGESRDDDDDNINNIPTLGINGDGGDPSSEEPISRIMNHLILGDKESEGQEEDDNNPSNPVNPLATSEDKDDPNSELNGEEGGEDNEKDDSSNKILPDLPGEEDGEEEVDESTLPSGDNGGLMEVEEEGHSDDEEGEVIAPDIITKSRSKPSSKHGEESDEDIAMIRIRDIGSLRDDDSEDEGEIITASPVRGGKKIRNPPPVEEILPTRSHAPYILMGKYNEGVLPGVSIQMVCVEDRNVNKVIFNRERRKKSIVLRQQLIELSGMLKGLAKKGQPGINIRQPETNNSIIPNQASSPSVGKTPPPPPPAAQTPINRLSGSSPILSSVVRPNSNTSPVNCVVTSRGIQQVLTTPNPVTYSRMNRPTRPHILNSGANATSTQQIRGPGVTGNVHQIVFDPNSGLLLCPTSKPGTATTASQQVANANNRQSYRAIQAPPQFLAAMRSGSIQMVNGGTSITRMIQPNANLEAALGINSPATIVRNPAPVQMTASQFVRQQNPRQASVTVMTPASTNVGSGGQPLRTYQNIAPKNQGGAAPYLTNNPQIPPAFGAAVNTVFARAAQPTTVSGTVNAVRNPSTPPFRPTTPNFQTPHANNKPRQIYQPPATAAPASASYIRRLEAAKQIETTAGSQPSVINNPKDKPGQNAKTFPSLVVVVKPYLQEKLTKAQASSVRGELDSIVKNILMQSPVKFTEWLIQKGLLKMEHKCYNHNTAYKLGMYSDSEKYPYSGGYVFTVDCCPDKQLPVFQGSIFEASVYPPGTTMKLVYHWACQTPAPSVLQWVKVTSYYLKNFYTLLRSVCVSALHEHASIMGGRGKYIEVGVVTLGAVPGTQTNKQQTKIEILGVFDPGAKFIRMRLLNSNPNLVGDAAKRERSDQILTPLSNWVNRDSVLLIDSSLDKATVEKLGFRNVSQSKSAVGAPVKTTIPTNVNVMNYLKNIVPKMFQNTLCVLSKSLIQQFLDELSWRELWGSHPLKAFETVITHLVGMTKADNSDLLIPRLNKISLNPFAEWSYTQKTLPPPSGIECLPDSIRSQPLSELVASAVGMDSAISSLVSTYMNTANLSSQPKSVTPSTSLTTVGKFGSIGETLVVTRNNSNTNTAMTRTGAVKRKAPEEDVNGINLQRLLAEGPRSHTLQAYYYIYCPPSADKYCVEFPSNMKCPLCNKVLKGNNETLAHLISHVLSAGRLTQNPHGCRYCLKEVATAALLEQHVNYAHKKLNEDNVCRICADKYPSETLLILHMWKRHVNCEAPYRCEVCEYRTSFHYDVIDHFYKEHSSTDTVQCPVCLKGIPVRSIACLKSVVTHLQNHILKKGKKCRDCCLSFSTDIDYRSHLLVDSAHETRITKNFVQHEVDDTPIRMPKPPVVDKDLNIPPAPKKGRSGKSGSNQSNLQTLNSSFAVPLNPSDKYMFTPMKIKISDVDMFTSMNCWECFKSITLPGHYRGTMKCSRCRFETCCSFTIHKHIKSHDIANLDQTVVRTQLALSRETDLACDALECSGCHFISGSTRRFAYHLLDTGHKACAPKEATGAESAVPPADPSSSRSDTTS